MTNNRMTYIQEFNRDAVRLAGESGSICSVARDLGIDHSLWQDQVNASKSSKMKKIVSGSKSK